MVTQGQVSVHGGDRRAGRSRRWLGVVVAAGLAVGTPVGMAAADPPTSDEGSGASVRCDDEPYVEVYVGQEDGSTFLELYVEGDFGWGGGFTDDASFDGSELTAEVEVSTWSEDDDEEVLGVATVQAALTPIGEPETYEDDDNSGNRRFRIAESFQDAAVSGSVVLDGLVDVDLSDCDGRVYAFSYWSTNPAASVWRGSGMYLDCSLASPDGERGWLFAGDGDEDEGDVAEVYLDTDDGYLFGFTDAATFTTSVLTATVDLYDEDPEHEEEADSTGPPVATAQVDMALESVGRETERFRSTSGRYRERIESFTVTGTVVVDGVAWAPDDCRAQAYDYHEQYVDPGGPPTTGPAPSNDQPEDAEPVRDGETIRDRTNTAVPPPEATCVVHGEDGEEGESWSYEVPLGKTLWYVLVGDGHTWTVDTAGSGFDTVLGVYRADLEPVACVDDVFTDDDGSLQAAITFDTEPGATYLVQVGGYGFFPDEGDATADYGRLLMTVTSG